MVHFFCLNIRVRSLFRALSLLAPAAFAAAPFILYQQASPAPAARALRLAFGVCALAAAALAAFALLRFALKGNLRSRYFSGYAAALFALCSAGVFMALFVLLDSALNRGVGGGRGRGFGYAGLWAAELLLFTLLAGAARAIQPYIGKHGTFDGNMPRISVTEPPKAADFHSENSFRSENSPKAEPAPVEQRSGGADRNGEERHGDLEDSGSALEYDF